MKTYQEIQAKTFLAELSCGGTDGGAQAWANYKVHEAAEKQVEK